LKPGNHHAINEARTARSKSRLVREIFGTTLLRFRGESPVGVPRIGTGKSWTEKPKKSIGKPFHNRRTYVLLNAVHNHPIFAFAGFELKPLDEPKRIVDRQDFGLVGGEFFGSFGTAKDAVAFFVEMSAGGEEELGEDVVVVGDGEVEAGAEGGEGSN
jgi:hypothetical protein